GKVPAARIAASATLQELGLDSLATVQLAAAIEERIEIEVPVEMLVGRTLAAQRGGTEGGVLLTGATGSLGSYLLCELLARSSRRVICLVRARDAGHARDRLRSTAQRLGLAPDLARVDVICGDLAAPRLGLADDDLSALAARTWRIVHAGARVDW